MKRKGRVKTFEAEQRAREEYARQTELRAAQEFGRAVRREHEALGKVLVMLSHIIDMPTIPSVVKEAREAFSAVQLRTPKDSPAGALCGTFRDLP